MPLLSNQSSRLIGNRVGIATPIPTYGTELLANGGFGDTSVWTVGTDWSIANGKATHVNGQATNLTQEVGGAGQMCVLTWDFVRRAGSGVVGRCGGSNGPTRTVTGSYVDTRLTVSTNTGFGANPSSDCDVDNASFKAINIPSIFSTKNIALTDAIVKCKTTIGAVGSRAGIVGWLDSATDPKNCIMASHDGVNARLSKRVNNTWTDLISTAATYVAGAYIEIRRTAGTNTFQLWYNGLQVGTDQTISDAGIISNPLAGYMNMWTANTVSDFSAVAS